VEQKRLNEITQTLLIDTSQIAITEDTQKTLYILQQYISFFRYAIRKSNGEETLLDEVKALSNYIEYCKIHYGNQFTVSLIFNYQKCNSVLIQKMKVIDAFDQALNVALSEYFSGFDIGIHFDLDMDTPHFSVSYSKDDFEKRLSYDF